MAADPVRHTGVMKPKPDPQQSVQRVKVGMIGLAIVILLIGLASAIIGSASRDRALPSIGTPHSDVVANMALANEAAAGPLAELGVAPSTGNAQSDSSAAR